jgi:prophage antirepressor-like protein
MNEIQLFTDGEFNMRTAVVDGEPLFCLVDVCKVLDIQNPSKVAQRLDDDERTKLELGRQGETNFITESGLYAVILRSDKPNAKSFRRWVTSEVLPSIRKTGNYSAKPMTTEEKIKLLAQGNTELSERVDRLENDMPLYGCEIDEVQKLVKRKAVSVLGGKDSEAYADRSIRSQTFKDIYCQLKREFGCVATYKSIKRRYIDNVREFIDGYSAPTALSEQISGANAQMNIGQYCDARR